MFNLLIEVEMDKWIFWCFHCFYFSFAQSFKNICWDETYLWDLVVELLDCQGSALEQFAHGKLFELVLYLF